MKHDHRDKISGKFAKIPEGSQPHRTSHRGGRTDMDREMEHANYESQRFTEGRWDDSEIYDKAASDGLDKQEDWKGRGNTVRGVWQGSQHRRVHAGYDVAEHVTPSEISNYTPENTPRFAESHSAVIDARMHSARPKPEPGNDHESFLTGGQ
jgi:hypothetical protein